ncbi:uncharacterized protein MONOS_5551 [Monocercomonoides exilis]|uniref:uncharacterized protein n=1 Tax=Monocercomonoides exilis TaxID=2049356 RepID=UPI003559F58D|nr:hypothetical protein MONOS_5551 [Monocercomonoides exilis]|eukprot:MONOS_5551.1-p1 / transcript=MONOS_5551.1 / gene=MONOS_5551 / organism=Monocercomonoides_exilis_PA203 / gene_product=unspecified product / transcript_product=unspecified product / location=Mono_scaffold00163:22490-28704(+) / protein_length=2031 / sequence_SO=supercontig / SO=protein_coding / is_pseudo=false
MDVAIILRRPIKKMESLSFEIHSIENTFERNNFEMAWTTFIKIAVIFANIKNETKVIETILCLEDTNINEISTGSFKENKQVYLLSGTVLKNLQSSPKIEEENHKETMLLEPVEGCLVDIFVNSSFKVTCETDSTGHFAVCIAGDSIESKDSNKERRIFYVASTEQFNGMTQQVQIEQAVAHSNKHKNIVEQPAVVLLLKESHTPSTKLDPSSTNNIISSVSANSQVQSLPVMMRSQAPSASSNLPVGLAATQGTITGVVCLDCNDSNTCGPYPLHPVIDARVYLRIDDQPAVQVAGTDAYGHFSFDVEAQTSGTVAVVIDCDSPEDEDTYHTKTFTISNVQPGQVISSDLPFDCEDRCNALQCERRAVVVKLCYTCDNITCISVDPGSEEQRLLYRRHVALVLKSSEIPPDGQPVYFTYTDENGSAILYDVCYDTYTLIVDGAGIDPTVERDIVIDQNTEQPTRVTYLRSELCQSQVSVHVCLDCQHQGVCSDQPLPETHVVVLDSSGANVAEGTTEANGDVSFTLTPPFNGYVQLLPNCQVDDSSMLIQPLEITESSTNVRIDFPIVCEDLCQKPCDVGDIHVVACITCDNSNCAKVEQQPGTFSGFTVVVRQIFNPSGGDLFEQTLQLSDEGEAFIPQVCVGEYEVTLYDPSGYSAASNVINLQPGELARVELLFNDFYQCMITINGHVCLDCDRTGTCSQDSPPISDGYAELRTLDGFVYGRVLLDPNGDFQIAHEPSSDLMIDLTVNCPEYAGGPEQHQVFYDPNLAPGSTVFHDFAVYCYDRCEDQCSPVFATIVLCYSCYGGQCTEFPEGSQGRAMLDSRMIRLEPDQSEPGPDGGVHIASTNSDGVAAFVDICAQSYILTVVGVNEPDFVMPVRFTPEDPNPTVEVVLENQELCTSHITGVVCLDCEETGTCSSDSPKFLDVPINIYDETGSLVASDKTTEGGSFDLSVLMPLNGRIEVSVPCESTAGGENPQVFNYLLEVTEPNQDQSFEFPVFCVDDCPPPPCQSVDVAIVLCYSCTDGECQPFSADSPALLALSNRDVELISINPGPDDPTIWFARTDSTGTAHFYSICEGDLTMIVSGVGREEDHTEEIHVQSGEQPEFLVLLRSDEFCAATISGIVCLDCEQQGACTAASPRLSDVTVTYSSAGQQPLAVITDSTGYYSMTVEVPATGTLTAVVDCAATEGGATPQVLSRTISIDQPATELEINFTPYCAEECSDLPVENFSVSFCLDCDDNGTCDENQIEGAFDNMNAVLTTPLPNDDPMKTVASAPIRGSAASFVGVPAGVYYLFIAPFPTAEDTGMKFVKEITVNVGSEEEPVELQNLPIFNHVLCLTNHVITGTVCYDCFQNGSCTAPAEGMIITATNDATGEVAQAVTDSNGVYYIYPATSGVFNVSADLSFCENEVNELSRDYVRGTSSVNVIVNQQSTTGREHIADLMPFCEVECYRPVSGCVFCDVHHNGTDEMCNGDGFEGVVVVLLDENNDVLAETLTDENGHYTFIGVLPGSYTAVGIDVPACGGNNGSGDGNRTNVTVPFDVFPEDEEAIVDLPVNETGNGGYIAGRVLLMCQFHSLNSTDLNNVQLNNLSCNCQSSSSDPWPIPPCPPIRPTPCPKCPCSTFPSYSSDCNENSVNDNPVDLALQEFTSDWLKKRQLNEASYLNNVQNEKNWIDSLVHPLGNNQPSIRALEAMNQRVIPKSKAQSERYLPESLSIQNPFGCFASPREFRAYTNCNCTGNLSVAAVVNVTYPIPSGSAILTVSENGTGKVPNGTNTTELVRGQFIFTELRAGSGYTLNISLPAGSQVDFEHSVIPDAMQPVYQYRVGDQPTYVSFGPMTLSDESEEGIDGLVLVVMNEDLCADFDADIVINRLSVLDENVYELNDPSYNYLVADDSKSVESSFEEASNNIKEVKITTVAKKKVFNGNKESNEQNGSQQRKSISKQTEEKKSNEDAKNKMMRKPLKQQSQTKLPQVSETVVSKPPKEKDTKISRLKRLKEDSQKQTTKEVENAKEDLLKKKSKIRVRN